MKRLADTLGWTGVVMVALAMPLALGSVGFTWSGNTETGVNVAVAGIALMVIGGGLLSISKWVERRVLRDFDNDRI